MSSEDDTTQPLGASSLEQVDQDASKHHSGYVKHTHQPGTLPSTTLGASTDGHKFLAPEIAATAHAPIAAAFPSAHHVVPSPAYHKPMMSQSESALFDEEALFPDSNNGEASKAVHANGSSQSPPSAVAEIIKNLDGTQNADADNDEAVKVALAELKSSRTTSANTSTTSVAPSVVKAPRLDSDSLNADTNEDAANEDEEAPKVENDGGSDAGSLVEGDMEKDLADIQDHINNSYHEDEAEVASRQKAPARSSRGRRKPSASQGVNYDYYGTGTLHNESEDEDGGWGSGDEAHATQTLMAPKLNFGSDDEGERTDDEEYTEIVAKKEQPSKKQRIVPYEPSDEEDDNQQVEYGDMEVDEPEAPKKSNGLLEVSVIDDEEVDETVSRPRPSLGNVGRTAKDLKPKSSVTPSKATTKSGTTPSKSAAKKDESAMEIVDSDGEETAPTKRRTSVSTNGKSTPASKKTTTTSDEASEPKSKPSAKSATPSKKTAKAEEKESQASKNSLSQSSGSQAKSSKSDGASTPKPTPSKADGLDVSFVEEVSPRPKRGREALRSPKKVKKSAGDKVPSEELARLLRINAKESIAKYLEEEAGDMEAFYTQRNADMSATPVEPPADLLKNFQFIVTGLRGSSSNSASSAGWIKLQIKALGGKLVNARSVNRMNRAKLDARKRGLPTDRQESVYLPQCILISEKPQRTLKYVNALVNSVPCVHYRWFLTSLHLGKLLPLEEFMLPAGYNEDATLVTQPDWMAQEDVDNIAGNQVYPFWTPDASVDPIVLKSISLANESTERNASGTSRLHGNARSGGPQKTKLKVKRGPDNYRVQIIGILSFQEQWKTILTQAGAKIVDRLSRTADYGRIDFVLSDSEPTDLSIAQATDRGLPLCTIDWALQSIIQRKVQDPKSKPAYTLNIEEWN